LDTTALPAPGRPLLRGSKRLLATRGDAQLLTRVRSGDAAAFEVLYERHLPGILSFCRHMLGSREEAEDAVQLVFVSAHQSLLRDGRAIQVKPWLYTIARNRCLSLLRARREGHAGEVEGWTAGLPDEVERRSELRELVADLQTLPEDQRAALVLTELEDLSHVEVAGVLGCEPAKVKGLVFRARSVLIERREGRAAPCEEIRAELAMARGGALRRSRLRHHLRTCDPCAAFREDLGRQRTMLALVLPIVPTIGLKQGVMEAVGLGGGGAAGGGAAAGASALAGNAAAGPSVTAAGGAAVGGGTAASGALAAGGGAVGAAAPLASATLAKVVAVAVVAGGAGAAGIGVGGSDDPGIQRTSPAQGQRAAPRPRGNLRSAGPQHGSPTGGGGSRRLSTEEPPGGTARAKGRNGQRKAASAPGRTGERGSSNARRRARGEGRAGPGGAAHGGQRRVGRRGSGKPVTTKPPPKGSGRKAPTRGGARGRAGTPPPPRKRGPKRPSAPPGRSTPQGKARPKVRDLPSQGPDTKSGAPPKRPLRTPARPRSPSSSRAPRAARAGDR